jgi:hypothetical protein
MKIHLYVHTYIHTYMNTYTYIGIRNRTQEDQKGVVGSRTKVSSRNEINDNEKYEIIDLPARGRRDLENDMEEGKISLDSLNKGDRTLLDIDSDSEIDQPSPLQRTFWFLLLWEPLIGRIIFYCFHVRYFQADYHYVLLFISFNKDEFIYVS